MPGRALGRATVSQHPTDTVGGDGRAACRQCSAAPTSGECQCMPPHGTNSANAMKEEQNDQDVPKDLDRMIFVSFHSYHHICRYSTSGRRVSSGYQRAIMINAPQGISAIGAYPLSGDHRSDIRLGILLSLVASAFFLDIAQQLQRLQLPLQHHTILVSSMINQLGIFKFVVILIL